MALGISKQHRRKGAKLGSLPEWHHIRFTGDNPYPAGGYAVTPAQVDFRSNIRMMMFGKANVGATYYLPVWDEANNKILVLVAATGVEAGAVDLSTMVFDGMVFGE